MAVDYEKLDAVVRVFVDKMPNALAARVHAFLMRELADSVEVLPARADDESGALLAIDEDGGVSVCRADAGGATVVVLGRLRGATLTKRYEISESRGVDSSARLQSWTLWHPSLPRAAGTLTIDVLAAASSLEEQQRITDRLQRLIEH